jgi:polysaccharide export outer membrane protein
MKTIGLIIIAGLSAFTFSSVSAQTMVAMQTKVHADAVYFKYESDCEYTLQKDDKININVWDNNDLTMESVSGIYKSDEVYGKWLVLDEAGNVTIPKLGEINLAGLTALQAKDKIKARFKKYIANPLVELKVLNRKYNWKQLVVDKHEYTALKSLEMPDQIYYTKN